MVKIKWTGDFTRLTGYSEASRQYCTALNMLGCDLITDSITNQFPVGYGWMAELSKKDSTGYFNIRHTMPDIPCDGYYTVFEMDRAPEEWGHVLKKAKLVLTPSKFSAASLSTVCDPMKIKVINHGINPRYTPLGKKLKFSTQVPRFKFLSVYEWVERKCPEIMIKAFCEEFKPDEDVGLFIKTTHWNKPLPLEINKLAKDNNVYLIENRVDDMSTLYRAFDAYVSPTAGEGWGETLSEAMACGLPTIGPGHGGSLEFMNEKNSWQVEHDDWSPVGFNQLQAVVKPWFRFKLPKKESIRKAMRAVFEGGEDVRARAKEGRKIAQTFTWEKAARKIMQHVEEVQK